MGMGKTYISATYMDIRSKFHNAHKSIVLAPKIMLSNWKNEILKNTDLTCLIYTGTPTQKRKLKDQVDEYNVVITNYEALSTNSEDLQFFKNKKWDHIFVDEASKIKTDKRKRSESVLALSTDIQYRFILSGTLSLGNPLDIFTPFLFLSSAILGSNFYRFKNKVCKFSPYNRHIIIGYKNLDTIKNRIDPFSVIMNTEDYLSLPERTFGIHSYTLSNEQKDLCAEIITEDSVTLQVEDNNYTIPTNTALIKINKLLQVLSGFFIINDKDQCDLTEACDGCPGGLQQINKCRSLKVYPWSVECRLPEESKIARPERIYYNLKNNPKLELLREDILSLSSPACVWCMYKEDLRQIKTLLTDIGVSFVTSDTPEADQLFQKGDIQIFLGQISTGIGITLTKATTTIYYSHSLKLEDRLQSMERNYRIGQKDKVVVLDYVGESTIEEAIIELLSKKQDVRDFIHQNLRDLCNKCEKHLWCMDRDIQPYTKKCIHRNFLEGICAVKHIKI
jgi:SNF2 family DNA or RNA helicase